MPKSLVTSEFTLVNLSEWTGDMTKGMTEGLDKAMRKFGWALFQARVQERMHEGDAPAKVYAFGNQTGKLYRRTGRLQRAFVRGKAGNIYDLQVTANGIELTVGVDTSVVPYAQAHEYGATFTQTITPKQRRFFWAKFYETKEQMWMFMALKKKMTIRIPARPYLTPAFQEFIDNDLITLIDIAVSLTKTK